MATTVDHLRAGLQATVIRGFVDARGVHHTRGESGRIEGIRIDWATNEIAVSWRRGARAETMFFPLSGGIGPGNGRMREFFACDEVVEAPPRAAAAGAGPPIRSAPVTAEPGPEVITGEAHYDDAVARVIALAARGRLADADAQLRALDHADPRSVARDLSAAVEQFAAADDAVFGWLRGRATDYWYAWGSEATSGGDGAARLLDIRPAMERFRRLEQQRRNVQADPSTPSGER